MATNAKTQELDLTVDRCHALEAEVMRLTAELESARGELEEERNHSASLKRLVERAKARIRELEGDAAGTTATSAGEPETNPDSSRSDGGVDLTFGSSRNRNRNPKPEQAASTVKTTGRKKRRTKKKAAENVYVFDDHDETRVAFDEFFAHSDPHLEKVRGFLLD